MDLLIFLPTKTGATKRWPSYVEAIEVAARIPNSLRREDGNV
jgi:hypothetical protein